MILLPVALEAGVQALCREVVRGLCRVEAQEVCQAAVPVGLGANHKAFVRKGMHDTEV